MKKFLALNLSDVVFIMLINVKMPTIVRAIPEKNNLGGGGGGGLGWGGGWRRHFFFTQLPMEFNFLRHQPPM